NSSAAPSVSPRRIRSRRPASSLPAFIGYRPGHLERRRPLGKVSASRGAMYGFLTPRDHLYSAACLGHKVVDFAIQLAVVLFVISFHESAHAYAALKFGDTTARDLGRISLNPIRHIDPVGSILVPLMLYLFSGLIFGAAKPTPVDLRNTRDPRLANLVVS